MIPIILENNMCIVVNKPSNMPAQKDFSRSKDMLSLVEEYLGKKAFLIHRLDRHVAGPVVIAKTKEGAASLNKQLNANGFSKIYKAVVVHPSKNKLLLNEDVVLEHFHKKEQSIAKIISKSQMNQLNDSDKSAFKAVKLKYRCLKTKTYDTISLSLLEIELFTGRFHQIRAQLSYEGLGILGDPKYGEVSINGESFKEIGLQSTLLKFKDPKTKQELTAQAEHYNGPFMLFIN